MRHHGLMLAAATAGAMLSGCSGLPSAPTLAAARGGGALNLYCEPSLLIGQRGICVAFSRDSSGLESVITSDLAWSSSRPEVVSVDGMGGAMARSAGQALVTVSGFGQHATASIDVVARDAVLVFAGSEQGAFTPGSTVTMWLQGNYSVASAGSGRLSLRITDQTGATIASSSPVTVANGGDHYIHSVTFVVPQDSTQVCRATVLELGPVVIAESPNAVWRCISIRR